MASVQLGTGARLDVPGYLQLSSPRTRPDMAPIFYAAVQNQFLQAAATYQERLIHLSDRLIVDRELKLHLKAGVCLKTPIPAQIRGYCFVPKDAQIRADTLAELNRIRAKLKGSPKDFVSEGITAAEASAMDDRRLLDLLLNGSEQNIRLLSIIPLNLAPDDIRARVLKGDREVLDFSRPLATRVRSQFPEVDGKPDEPATGTKAVYFAKKYFLTGDTVTREYGDEYEHTLASANWLHGRYYLQVSWYLSYAVGWRWPFEITANGDALTTVGLQFTRKRYVHLSVVRISIRCKEYRTSSTGRRRQTLHAPERPHTAAKLKSCTPDAW